MHQTVQLVDALKTALWARGVTYRDVASALVLSEASVKHIFAQQSFSLERLKEIFRIVDVLIYELTRPATHRHQQTATTLTVEQETALARDPELLAYFYLLINGWTAGRIRNKLK